MRADGLVVAVDGGGVKTDLALLDSTGALLSLIRGGTSQPHYLGVEGCVGVLEGLLETAIARAGLDPLKRPVASTAQLLLAGMDLPEELSALRAAMARLEWSEQLVIGNDTEALLRAAPTAGGESQSCVAPGSTAWELLRRPADPTRAKPGSSRSAPYPATGAAAATSVSPRLLPPFAPPTGGARGRCWSAACRRTSV